MVKLTADLIVQCMQYTNPVRDRELDLRGYKVPVIENMGATLDQFDTIDFSNNDIRKIDGFPLLKRLSCLFFNNNRIVRIAENLQENIPNLETLILTGNNIQELGDLDPLSTLPKLKTLCLLHNPVINRPHYRLYVAFKLPQLKLLDFSKIKLKEREEAATLFKSKKGKELQKEISKKAKTFVPGAALQDLSNIPSGPSAEEVWKIKEAISKASSLEEIERLNKLLQSGQIPGREDSEKQHNGKVRNGNADQAEEEEDEEMETDQQNNQRQPPWVKSN
uniref:Probable U2 small nuclear ribonucleoprotein A' n=1 Tax=Cacopsylla melanoneura TaxID=428564 RepID=A0A8D8MDG7_9HEMI